MTAPKIDPEKLAALLDGRMNEADRRELMSRMANSPEDLALIADVAAARRDSNPGVAPISDAPSRRVGWRMGGRGWMAIAAGIVGITTVTVLARRDSSGTRALPKDLDFVMWDRSRGSGAASASSYGARSWRVGARITDLELAITARDSVKTRAFAGEIRDLLADPRLIGAQAYFGRVADSPRADPRDLTSYLREGRSALVTPLDTNVIRLGAWVERARVAAHQGDSAFFKTAASRQSVSDLVALNAPYARELAAAINAANLSVVKDKLAELLQAVGR